MKLRTQTEWRTRDGARRRIRLYKTWRNMRDRTTGTNYAGNKSRAWVGVEIRFSSWSEFRAWALRNGYSSVNNSLDRYPDAYGPYADFNCRFVTVGENTSWQNLCKFLRDQEAEQNEDDHPTPQVGALRHRRKPYAALALEG